MFHVFRLTHKEVAVGCKIEVLHYSNAQQRHEVKRVKPGKAKENIFIQVDVFMKYFFVVNTMEYQSGYQPKNLYRTISPFIEERKEVVIGLRRNDCLINIDKPEIEKVIVIDDYDKGKYKP